MSTDCKTTAFFDTLLERYPALAPCGESIGDAYHLMAQSLSHGGKILAAGNGGSAADACHFCGELEKAFILERRLQERERAALVNTDAELGAILAEKLQQGLPVQALGTNPALCTAIANDVDGQYVFAQELWSIGTEGDVLLAISTSGNSGNILCACVAARARGMKVVLLTGGTGGKARSFADCTVCVPETDCYKVQELHLPVYHTWALMLEHFFFGRER